MNYPVQGAAEHPRASVEKLAYTIAETCYATGLGRTMVYELIAKEKLRAVKAGTRTLIPAESIRGYLASLHEAA
ncbi:helix-turn-helix domain-containing protein [Methylobacterium aquaticum]|uniref:helix-turn-helix domain-containing protein n=1 Tax=Methylobacterium aquaticum TaxID=270351 RepID=UPI003D181A52